MAELDNFEIKTKANEILVKHCIVPNVKHDMSAFLHFCHPQCHNHM
jgi:hypothetical protein